MRATAAILVMSVVMALACTGGTTPEGERPPPPNGEIKQIPTPKLIGGVEVGTTGALLVLAQKESDEDNGFKAEYVAAETRGWPVGKGWVGCWPNTAKAFGTTEGWAAVLWFDTLDDAKAFAAEYAIDEANAIEETVEPCGD